MNVLILDGNTYQALATARSLKGLYNILLISNRKCSLTSFSNSINDKFVVKEENINGAREILKISMKNKVRIILPMTERSCQYLNLIRDEFEKNNIIIGTVSREILDIALDKYKTYLFCKKHGIKVPHTELLKSDSCDDIKYPIVIKERYSNKYENEEFQVSAAPRYIINNEYYIKYYNSITRDNNNYIIQEVIEGDSIGIFGIALEGETFALFSHKRIRDVNPVGSGSSLRESREMLPEEIKYVKGIIKNLNWSGPIMFEFKKRNESLILIEINGRMWGSLQLAIDSGVDFPKIWIKILLGEYIDELKPVYNKVILRNIFGDMKRLLYIIKGKPKYYYKEFPSIINGFIEFFGKQPNGTKYEVIRYNDMKPIIGAIINLLK